MSIIKQFSFAAGEVAPAIYGRVDQVRYATGLRTCRNSVVMRHGGVKNREGTIYRAETKDSSVKSRIIPFIFNTSQTYVLELGNEYMRFMRDGAQVTVSGVSAWASGTPYSVGDLASSAGTNYYCKEANTGSGGNAPPSATYWHGLTGNIYEIPTPYQTADLFDIHYVQSADVVTLTHPSYQQRNLARTDHTAWTLTPITMEPAQQPPTNVAVAGDAGAFNYIYHVTSVSSETQEESLATTASGVSLKAADDQDHTITWDAASGAGYYRVYIEENGLPSFIGETAELTFTNDGIEPDISDQPPEAKNPFNATGDYPSTSSYFQQRQWFANTDNNPETIWGSRTGLFTNFTVSTPGQDDDALEFSMNGNRVNEVNHLLELKTLIALTAGVEWSVNGDDAGIVRPTAINSKQHTYNGSANLQPIIINGDVIYLQARGYKFRSLFYTIEADGYRGTDLTTFSAHLVDGYTISDWDFQQNPHSVVYAVRSDGNLVGMTYLREHELIGWHRHDTDGEFESTCVVPEGSLDVPYFIVKRTINGVTKRYIESMAPRYEEQDEIKDAIFMDSTLSYDGRNTGSQTMTIDKFPFGSDLFGAYLMEDASGDLTDSVGSNDLELYDAGNNTYQASGVNNFSIQGDDGIPGNSSKYAASGTTWVESGDEFSLSFWVYFKSGIYASSDVYLRLTDNQEPDGKLQISVLAINDGDPDSKRLRLTVGVSDKDHAPGQNIQITLNEQPVPGWYHIVYRQDSTNRGQAIINADFDTAGSYTSDNPGRIDSSTWTSDQVLRLGDLGWDSSIRVDELYIWKSRLTDDAVTELYNSGSGRFYGEGTEWTDQDTIEITSSTDYFVAGDVGNSIHFFDSDGDLLCRCEITAYSSGTIVLARPDRDIPSALQGVATTSWGKAVDQLSGLGHLEGKDVSILADGFVIGSPNNPGNTTYTVSSGSLTLPTPYVVIHVGLPYLSDIETLDIDTAQGRTLIGDKKLVTKLWATYENTRGIWAGIDPPASGETAIGGLYENKIRDTEGYDDPVYPLTGSDWVSVEGTYNGNGRVFFRQVDPLPVKILAVAPAGLISGA